MTTQIDDTYDIEQLVAELQGEVSDEEVESIMNDADHEAL